MPGKKAKKKRRKAREKKAASKQAQASSEASRDSPRKHPKAMNGFQIAPLLLAVAAMASATKALVVAKTKSSKQSLRAKMPFALPTESVRMAAMASDAILSEALKKCQRRSGLACVLPVFVKRLNLENVSVPRERKTIAEGGTANSIVYPFMGWKQMLPLEAHMSVRGREAVAVV